MAFFWTDFFWMLGILVGASVVTVVAQYFGGWLYARRLAFLFAQERQAYMIVREKEVQQERFESQCWQAKLRRETEPTGIVEHELNGHHYIAVSHGLAEVPALYLSMRRMMIEVEGEKEIYGNGGKVSFGGQEFPVRKWRIKNKG